MDQFLQWFDRGGVAVVIVAFGLLFFAGKIWPYIVKRQDRLDAESKARQDKLDAEEKERVETRAETEKERHKEYMKVIGDFASALNAVNMTTNALGQLISNMTNKIDDNHAAVMAELRRK